MPEVAQPSSTRTRQLKLMYLTFLANALFFLVVVVWWHPDMWVAYGLFAAYAVLTVFVVVKRWPRDQPGK